jgi:hypothetical protein
MVLMISFMNTKNKTHVIPSVSSGTQDLIAQGLQQPQGGYLPTTQSAAFSQDAPFLSVIINNYNYSAFLRQAIDSCLAQRYEQFEVIVVDDGSQDDSPQIIRSYGDRIIPVLKSNGGQASAINAGFAASRGEIIVLLDADDYLLENALLNIAAAWRSEKADPETVQMQCRLDLVNTEGERIDLYPAPEIAFDQGDVRSLLRQRGRYSTTVTSGISFHRRVLTEILPIPEDDFRISADGYLVTVAPFYGAVGCIETVIGARREHQNNFWAQSGQAVSLPHLHKSIQHDFTRYQYLIQTTGEELDPEQLGLGDHVHIMDRLPSCLLAPEQHPCPADRPILLALRGLLSLRHLPSYSARRKFILGCWFLWIGFAPKALAHPIMSWLLVNGSRPQPIDRLLKMLRRITQ